MATTKIWPISGKISDVLQYISSEEKTDSLKAVLGYVQRDGNLDQQFITGIGCSPDTARMEMDAVKQQFGKAGGRIAYHAYQSFRPGEVSPEQAHEIGVQFATELWGNRFQVVIATHLDRSHLHNHFVVNSVSFLDGRRFHSDAKFLQRMQAVSDRLCREHGLSVVEHPKGTSRHHGEVSALKNGTPTWRSLIQSDIDRAIAASTTEQQFFRALRDMGYAWKSGKDLSVRPPGKERYFRLERNLGPDYTMDAIRKRVSRNIPRKTVVTVRAPPERHYQLKGTLPKRKKSHLRRMYLYYCYRLGTFQKHPPSNKRMHFLLREDLRKLNRYQAEMKLLHTYRIDTDVQLLSFQEQRGQEISQLCGQRNKLRNKLRRASAPEQQESLRVEISALTAQITKLRKEVRQCDSILENSRRITDAIQNTQLDERKEELEHGHQRTGR